MDDVRVEKSYCEWNWLPIALCGLALAVLLPLAGFTLDARGIWITLCVAGGLIGFAYVQQYIFGQTYWRVFFAVKALAQFIVLTAVITPLTYVAASLKFPMQDGLFASIDAMMGFSAEAFIAFVNEHKLLADMLNFGYGMIRWPIFVIPIVLAVSGRFLRLQQFMFAFIITLIVTCVVSALVPAMGVYQHYGIPLSKYPNIAGLTYEAYIKEIAATLDGSLRDLTLVGLQGLVTFPSFHAASAILYFWALAPVRFFGPLALVTNSLMILGTPTVGGHYLIDIIVGIAGAIAAIALAKSLTARFERDTSREAAPSSGVVTAANSLS